MAQQMNQATIFDLVMRELWGDDEDHGFVIDSIADKLRGWKGLDFTNALCSLEKAFPDCKVYPRLSDDSGNILKMQGEDRHSNDVLIFDLQFADDSKGLITADKYGRGNGFEWIG